MQKKHFKGFKAALLTALACSSMPVLSCPYYTDTFLGTVCYTAGAFCPRGYAEADGQLLEIAQNPTLFSLLGTLYGGDGRTTFALPDLRRKVPVGAGQGPGLSVRKQGEMYGQETVTLTANNLPLHQHAFKTQTVTFPEQTVFVPVSNKPGTMILPQGEVHFASRSDGAAIYTPATASKSAKIPISVPAESFTLSGQTYNAGRDSPVRIYITQPSLGLMACIAVTQYSPYPRRD